MEWKDLKWTKQSGIHIRTARRVYESKWELFMHKILNQAYESFVIDQLESRDLRYHFKRMDKIKIQRLKLAQLC